MASSPSHLLFPLIYLFGHASIELVSVMKEIGFAELLIFIFLDQ
jgi:hypothetical protein